MEKQSYLLYRFITPSLQEEQWQAKPSPKLYFDNFIKLMTWYYILKFTCNSSETSSCALQRHMKNASSVMAALSQRNEPSPMGNHIFIALTAYQMPEVLSELQSIYLNKQRGSG